MTAAAIVTERMLELIDAGCSTGPQLAVSLNAEGITTPKGLTWDKDRVTLHLRRAGCPIADILSKQRKGRHLSAYEQERIATLAPEGVPVLWIAEDLGRAYDTISRFISREHLRTKEMRAEWHRTWGQIKGNPELLKLHREFTPKAGARAA